MKAAEAMLASMGEQIAAHHKAAQDSGGLTIPCPDAAAFGLTDPADIAWVQRRLRPHPYGCYLSTQRLPNLTAGRGIKLLPRTYIDCIKPFYSDFNGTKGRVKLDAGWKYLTIETGHDAMVSAPQELAKLLLQA